MQPALRAYLTKLREAAYIEIKPGLVDSGASPNEIRPNYTAYVPPAAKKKKKFARARYRGKAPSTSTTGNLQTAAKTPSTTGAPAPSTTGTPASTFTGASAPSTAVASAASTTGTPASAAAAKPATQVASTSKTNALKPGKKEKVRFGQAPRESLPAGSSTETQTASAASPDLPAASSDSVIGAEAPADKQQGKTRFSDRPPVHKVKKTKDSPDDEAKASAPSQDELATQKVQDAPLGLADQQAKAKKAKTKGDKTRYADKQKQPEQVQQPYMGGEQPVDADHPAPATQPTQPAPAGDQPATKSSGGTQP
jgi:peptidyl-prolyl cis-trans isomerase SurA